MAYLFNHRNGYYFKRKIPRTQKNFLISLRTDSLKEAKFIIDIISPKFLIIGNKMNFDEELDYITEIIRNYVDEAKQEYKKFSKDREIRYSYTSKKGKERSGSHPKAIERAITTLTDGLHSPNRDELYNQIIEITNIKDQCNKALSILSEENKDRLKDEVIKAEIEILFNDKSNNQKRITNPNTYIKRSETPLIQTITNFPINDTETEFKHNLSIVATTETELKNNTRYYSKTAQELVELFKVEKAKEGLKELNRYKKILDVFLELTDKKYLIDLSSLDLKKFNTDFSDIPNENDKDVKVEIKGITSYKKWIEITREKNLLRVSDRTRRDKLIRIKSFLNFCVDMECLDKNRLIYKINPDESERRKEFRLEQLQNFFNTDWYNKDLNQNLKEEAHKIWIPLILLYSGARTNEISQLYINQIKEKDGVYFFKIKDIEEDQSTKNKSSNRLIPIHKTLLELGFLDYLEFQKKNNKERLFSELYLTKSKGYGQHFGKIFNDFKKTWLEEETLNKIKERKILLDLHSFRHTFTTASRAGKVSEEDISYILGHKKNQTQKYGSIPAKEFSNRINKIKYDLDFKILRKNIKNFYKN
jgi:integrase